MKHIKFSGVAAPVDTSLVGGPDWDNRHKYAYTLLSADASLSSEDFVKASGTITLTLPDATSVPEGLPYRVMNVDTGVITVNTSLSQTINGESSYVITNRWQYAEFSSDETGNWIATAGAVVLLFPSGDQTIKGTHSLTFDDGAGNQLFLGTFGVAMVDSAGGYADLLPNGSAHLVAEGAPANSTTRITANSDMSLDVVAETVAAAHQSILHIDPVSQTFKFDIDNGNNVVIDPLAEGGQLLFNQSNSLTGRFRFGADADPGKLDISMPNRAIAFVLPDGISADFTMPMTGGTLALVSQLFSGAYADLTGKPTLFSGVYADLTSKPTLPASKSNVTSKWLNSYDSSTGAFTQTQPAASDVSGLATSATTDATNASNISSGTLPAARIGSASLDLTTKVTGVLPPANGGVVNIASAGIGYIIGGIGVPIILGGNQVANVSPGGTINQVRCYQFVLSAQITIGHVSIAITNAAGSACVVDVGIYNSAGSLLLASNGGFNGNSATVQNLATSPAGVTLAPGIYYFAWCSSVVTTILARAISIDSGTVNVSAVMNKQTTKMGTAANAATAGILPPTLGVITAANVASMPVAVFEV